MDETWITANGRKLRVIVPRDWKTAPLIAENEKTVHITLIFCVSADGHFTTPTAILPNLQLFPPNLQDYQDHFVWSSSKSGWINEEIFTKWVATVFIPHLTTKRIFYRAPLQPAILFVDGHSTRSSSEAQAALSAANVFLVTLPSHTSHILQPLDCGVNRSFKQNLKKHVTHQHDGGVPGQRRMLVEAAVQASSAALNPITIRRAFQKSGVCPWNKGVILTDPTKVTVDPNGHQPQSLGGQRGASISGRTLVTPAQTFVAASSFLPAVAHEVVLSNASPTAAPIMSSAPQNTHQ